jgi:nucleotide-binding universal stress UspA family protein
VVVVGVDGSTTACRAVSFAAGIAARSRALLVLVHVQHPTPVPAWTGFGLLLPAPAGLGAGTTTTTGTTTTECPLLREARDAVQPACGGRLETVLRTGDPVAQLRRVAQDRRADVIVVGSSRSLRHRLWGSVPRRLAKRGHWPVVVVP